jgi:hypothetical protein
MRVSAAASAPRLPHAQRLTAVPRWFSDMKDGRKYIASGFLRSTHKLLRRGAATRRRKRRRARWRLLHRDGHKVRQQPQSSCATSAWCRHQQAYRRLWRAAAVSAPRAPSRHSSVPAASDSSACARRWQSTRVSTLAHALLPTHSAANACLLLRPLKLLARLLQHMPVCAGGASETGRQQVGKQTCCASVRRAQLMVSSVA